MTQLLTSKTWWAPVWRGLVVDERAKHYRDMGSAVWLFLYLLVHANRSTGEVNRKYITIAADMNIDQRTVRRWRHRLQKHGYITVESKERSRTIHIQRWKSILVSKRSGQYGTNTGAFGPAGPVNY